VAIKPLPQSIPTTLPPAKLYLDDIAEILEIFTDSSANCQASFVTGKSKCDTLRDLQNLGGRTNHFVMNVSSPGRHQTLELTPSSTRILIHEIGDPLPAWSKYVNVAAIFEKRKLRLKSVVRAIGWRLFAGLWLMTVALWMFVPYAIKPVSAYEWPRLATCSIVIAAIVYYFVSSQSIVYLRNARKVGAGRWLEEHKPEIIVGVICAFSGVLASQMLERFWK
jgi:hypothetical protein